jgi:hypothetical protein
MRVRKEEKTNKPWVAMFFSAFSSKKRRKSREKEKKVVYPTAIIRAKKNDHVVAIPPNR